MGDLVRFPPQSEVNEPNVLIEGLLYAGELKSLSKGLRALDAMDLEMGSGFAPPLGTIIPIGSELGVHIGNYIKVEEGVYGFEACMGIDCEEDDE